MPGSKQHRSLARRRGSADAGSVEDLVRAVPEPGPWATRRSAEVQAFRGRLRGGTAVLPAWPARRRERAVTLVVASRPIVLRSVGVAHPIPANVPWAVLAGVEWRITVTEPTDLRMVRTHEVPAALVDTAVVADRPTRFAGREGNVVRAAIVAATPSWIDASSNPVDDLAVAPQRSWTLVGTQSTPGAAAGDAEAFALLIGWAFEQRGVNEDPRLAAVGQYISSRLADPTLNIDAIVDQLRISRRTLQSLFEPEGGVAVYIRRLRLATALRLITEDPEQMPDLDTVAALTGLGSRRTLERAMRQVYELTPLQARAHLLAGHPLRGRHLNELQAS